MALNPRMIDWRGRRVWLVGASTGIGRALAASLHAQGAKQFLSMNFYLNLKTLQTMLNK